MSEYDSRIPLDHEQVVRTAARLTELVAGSTVTRLSLSFGPYKWEVESAQAAVGEVASTVAAQPTRSVDDEQQAGDPVTAPLVGVFYRSHSPNAPPYTAVGQQVAEGDQLAIIEAMKMMNAVVAPCAGVVREIHCDDGTIVEFGELLFTLARV